jgi:hypothetical protein
VVLLQFPLRPWVNDEELADLNKLKMKLAGVIANSVGKGKSKQFIWDIDGTGVCVCEWKYVK